MNRIIFLIILTFSLAGCSLNKSSKFWSKTKNISKENNLNYKEILVDEKALKKELNPNLKIKFKKKKENNATIRNYFNNDGRLNYNGNLKKSSRYKFSKIDNFYKFEPSISFDKKNIIFFDNKGSIFKFNN